MQGLKFIYRALFAATIVALPARASATSGELRITSNTELSEDHRGTIIIDADDVTLDCKGKRVTPDGGFSNGIFAAGVSNVRVVNCWVAGFFENVTFLDTHGATLENSEIADGETGIAVRGGAFLTITGNSVMRNHDGMNISSCSQVFVSDNLVGYNRDDGIGLSSVIDAYIENNPFVGHGQSDGLEVESSTLIRITGNIFRGNQGFGVDLRQSNNCVLQHNDLRSNTQGPFRVVGGEGNVTEPNTL